MSQTALYFRVGLFVLGGLFLLIGAVGILGLGHLLRDTIPAETYIDESVQGLQEGSPVQFRGVPIGQVEAIGFVTNTYPLAADDPRFSQVARLVMVQFNLDPSQLGGPLLRGPDGDDLIDRMIADGLRVRLASTGLTGIAYLEVTYVDPERSPPPDIRWAPRTLYLPATSSSLTRLQESAEGVFQDLGDAELAVLANDADQLIRQATGLVTDLRGFVTEVRGTIGGPALTAVLDDVRGALGQLSLASTDFRHLLGNVSAALAVTDLAGALQDTRAMLANLKAVTGEVDTLLKAVNHSAGPARLDELVANAVATVTDIRAVAAVAAREAPDVFLRLRETAHGIQGLSRSIGDVLADDHLSGIFADTGAALAHLRQSTIGLPDAVVLTNRALRRLNDVVATTQGNLSGVLDNLAVIAENLRQLSASARSYPAQIPFGAPPPRIDYGNRP